jgi:hypothetical protein
MIGLSRLWSWLTDSRGANQPVDSDKADREAESKNIELNVTVEELTITSGETEGEGTDA